MKTLAEIRAITARVNEKRSNDEAQAAHEEQERQRRRYAALRTQVENAVEQAAEQGKHYYEFAAFRDAGELNYIAQHFRTMGYTVEHKGCHKANTTLIIKWN